MRMREFVCECACACACACAHACASVFQECVRAYVYMCVCVDSKKLSEWTNLTVSSNASLDNGKTR